MTDLTFTGERAQGKADSVTASGHLSLVKQRGSQFKGTVASIDTDWYVALFSRPASSSDNVAQPQTEHRPPDQRNQPETLSILANLDAELSIGSIVFRTLTIGPGRLSTKGTGEGFRATVEPTNIADGQIEAAMTYTHHGTQAELDWSGKGQGLNVEAILQAVEPGETARMKGLGSFQTSGSGSLADGISHKNLNGSAELAITGGQFLRAPMFDFLAKETHIEEFKRMGFNDLRTTMRLEAGRIQVERLTATGSVSSLEGSVAVEPDGTVDGLIFVKIGPAFRESVKIPCMSAILVLPDGFATLPFAVRIQGTMKHATFRVDPSPWDQAKGTFSSLAGEMKNLVRGCRKES
jgi:hypothetical protein